MTNPETTPELEQRQVLPASANFDQLLEKLVEGKIPVETYGTGNAKTVNHLLSEVNEGEAIITIDNQGNVYREVNVLWVDVLCELSNGDVYYLREDRQEFKDGRTKRRALEFSIGEKLKPSEEPADAVRRALNEELGLTEFDRLHKVGYDEKTFVPDTFPGIESTYKMHKYVSAIPESGYKPEGYVEYQADKTNFYNWELMHSSADQEL